MTKKQKIILGAAGASVVAAAVITSAVVTAQIVKEKNNLDSNGLERNGVLLEKDVHDYIENSLKRNIDSNLENYSASTISQYIPKNFNIEKGDNIFNVSISNVFPNDNEGKIEFIAMSKLKGIIQPLINSQIQGFYTGGGNGNWNKPTGGGNNWNKPTQPGGGNGTDTGGGNGNKPTQPGGGNGTDTGGGNGNKPTQPGGGTGTDTGGNGNKPTQPGGGNGNWNKPTQPGGGNGTNTGDGNNWNKPTQPGGGNGTNTGGNNWNKPTQPGGGNGNRPTNNLPDSKNSIGDNVGKPIRISNPSKSDRTISNEKIFDSVNTSAIRKNDVIVDAPQNAIDQAINGKVYQPYYDMGFSWYQFFKTNDGHDNATSLINNLKSKGIYNVRLGFITAFNPKNPRKNRLVDWTRNAAASRSDVIMPTIAGILPLWYGNFATVNGGERSQGNWDKTIKFLNQLRNNGIDFTFSFGGWNADSLASATYKKNYTPADLKQLYANLIDKFKLKQVDFDIEGTDDGRTDDFGNSILGQDKEQINEARQLRLDAIKLLKEDPKYSNVRVVLTIPTLPSKIDNENIWMLKQALHDGIIDEISIMAMDFGEDAHNGPSGSMTLPGEMAAMTINAANAMKNLIVSAGKTEQEAYQMLGIIPMFGLNDTKNEIFYLTDAKILNDWSVRHNIKTLSGWSVIREMKNQISKTPALLDKHIMDIYDPDKMNVIKADSYTTALGIKLFAFTTIFSNFVKNKTIGTEYFNNPNFDFNGHIKPVLDALGLQSYDDLINYSKAENIQKLNNLDASSWKEKFRDEKAAWKLYIK